MFNKIDKDIINLLYYNGDISSDEIASKLGVSKGTVRNRLIRLKDEGVIKNYGIRAKLQKIGMAEVIVGLEIAPENYIQATKDIASYGWVNELYRTSGDHSVVAIIISDSETIQDKVADLLNVKGVKNVYPSFVQDLIK
ncbi:Lrp-AsnC family transcriptional regulator [Candidatus Mancarchaeum acidiphilum]|uniref:Lrp-AsnC family transcriptional regulator n=1 Tax=Candidatus Mancarchaeum acidiphilum TaxID=1920749 RepID=A0A218NNQ3_9ARCH|nr:Lrp/AsnC family transcriptional regulator [Candidatus Mancarchaeum acidiphilum]ASI14099.1 Lrp-AsnC family transcriptional regulator [Candidatus Mancarchaeum acidiphilum]